MWIHSDELTPDLLGLACLLLPGCFLLLGPATLCVLGIGNIPPNRMRQGTANTLLFVGWVSHLATECQAGLVLENDSKAGSVRLWGMEGLSTWRCPVLLPYAETKPRWSHL